MKAIWIYNVVKQKSEGCWKKTEKWEVRKEKARARRHGWKSRRKLTLQVPPRPCASLIAWELPSPFPLSGTRVAPTTPSFGTSSKSFISNRDEFRSPFTSNHPSVYVSTKFRFNIRCCLHCSPITTWNWGCTS